MEESNINFGEEMMRGRIRPNTHKIYASKVEVLRKWLRKLLMFVPSLIDINREICQHQN
jgi:hypothetical protein